MPTLAAANGSVKVMPHGFRRRLPVTAAGEQAAETADDVAQRDARRKHVARRPQRQADPPDVHERHGDRQDQPSIEDAARSQQCEQFARIRPEGAEIGEEQQQLGADECADDDVDAEVEDAICVQAAVLRPDHGELQAEQVRGGQQHAVGVQRELPHDWDRPELEQFWIHMSLA